MSAKKHITLTWTGLSASIKDKTLLHKCQGYCKPGEMLAIMGPSGAGKTTLLSLISQKADSKLLVKGIVLNLSYRFKPIVNSFPPLNSAISEPLYIKTIYSTKCSQYKVTKDILRNSLIHSLPKI